MVDANLGAVRLGDLRKVRAQVREKKTVTSPGKTAPDHAVLEGSQKLEPNKLYPASSNPSLQYYLPAYRLAENAAKPLTELRFDGEQDDDGEVGRLTIDFTWTAPPTPAGIAPQVMEHVTDLELRYRLPIQGSTNAAAREIVALQPLEVIGEGAARSTTVFADKLEFDAVYQGMRDPDRQATLHLKHEAQVGVRTWRQIMVTTGADKLKQASALQRRSSLITNVLSKETLSSVARMKTRASARVTVREDSSAEAARIRIMRDVIARPRILVRPAAPTVRPTVRVRPPQPAPVPPAGVRVRPVATATSVRTARVTATPVIGRAAAPALRSVRIAAAARAAVPVTAARADVPPAPTRGRVVVRSRPSATAAPVLTSATLARVNAPLLSAAVASSDLQLRNRAVVPLQLALDRRGKPAIVDAELECTAELPFHFDPRTQSSVYATDTFQTSGMHLLLPRTLTDESGRTNRIVYQDNLMPDVIHVAPTEYRLARSQEAPFLPGLSMLCADFGTTAESADQAEVLFNVVCSYELEPWLDPEIVELARAELAAEGLTARFTPIVPREAKLTLELDLLGDEKERGEAEIEASVGISDTLILNHDTFTRLWREHLANESGGVTGKVSYELFDGTPAQSRVSLSLWETSPDVFDVDFLGMVGAQPGRCRVRIRNRIESPAQIVRLPPERVSVDVVATPVDGANLAGRRLAPQETVEVDYQINPPDAVVDSLQPVVFGRVEPNLNALLKLFVLNTGYSSMSFAVEVKAAAGVFTPPTQGAEPLTGLLVEFDDGSKAELTPEEPETEVTLVGRLIDQLMGGAGDQQRYFYRVTNLHPSGEGARTGWKEGQGVEPVAVGTAVVQLDF